MKDLSYLTDSYDEKIERIHRIGAPLNFVFITDLHNRMNYYDESFRASRSEETPYELAKDHIRSIQYILDRCPEIDYVISGGDVGDDYHPDAETYKQSVREVYDELYKLSVPVHCIIGNHDDGLGNCSDRGYDAHTHTILPDEMHGICMKNNPTKENYYYTDTVSGYRLVFLNSIDYPNYFNTDGTPAFGWRLEISDKQAQWFSHEALATDKKVLVFSHAPLHNEGVFGTEGMPQGVKPFDDTLNAPRMNYAIAEHENVIANICGHVHYDNIVYNGRYLTISTLCSLVQQWCPTCPERLIGTPSETAFDVFSVTDKAIYITRFGAGADRQAEIVERHPAY